MEQHYRRGGAQILARRWRGRGGEIDLVARDGGELVFIEVKASASFAAAAAMLGPRQAGRIRQAAGEYLAGEPAGALTPVRFDVALLDGSGAIDIIRGAFGP